MGTLFAIQSSDQYRTCSLQSGRESSLRCLITCVSRYLVFECLYASSSPLSDTLRECRASLADEERRKKKKIYHSVVDAVDDRLRRYSSYIYSDRKVHVDSA